MYILQKQRKKNNWQCFHRKKGTVMHHRWTINFDTYKETTDSIANKIRQECEPFFCNVNACAFYLAPGSYVVTQCFNL